MRARVFTGFSFFLALSAILFASTVTPAHAEFTIYSQLDDSGEMTSQQPNFQNTWISAPLGSLFLGKEALAVTFTMKSPNAGSNQPEGVAFGSCLGCQDLQKYFFTSADRALLADGNFHTFTVTTGTTLLGIADGSIPIYITFFNLPQFQFSTLLKSNAEGTIPHLTITAAAQPTHPPVPEAPPGSVTVYTQSDNTGVMTNPQSTNLNSFIDSASLGNLSLGQGELYITFTMKDPNASNVFDTPMGVCIEPAGETGCNNRLQTYFFTDEDRALLADHAFHTFLVKTGTTSSTYADGTRPVAIGFFGLSQFQNQTHIKSNAEETIPYLVIQTASPNDPCAGGSCGSNVLFLPGLEASRLYKPDAGGGEDLLWEPSGDSVAANIAMNSDGTVVRDDIYTRDVIDNAYLPIKGNVYKSFLEQLETMKNENLISDYAAVPYDWRMALDDLLNTGKKLANGRLYYSGPLGATPSPYIIQELRRLAADSKTGKVTVIAHSNGGLLAKALTDRLGAEATELIDKIIFVAVPQVGTPQAIGAILHGFGSSLPIKPLSFLGISETMARTLARNIPSVYNLLPSENYFTYIDDPVITISDDPLLAPWRTAYGDVIHSGERLHNFLTDQARTVLPASDTLTAPIIGNEALLNDSETVHDTQDQWTPPSGIELIEIAGWGMPTLKTIAYYEGVRSTCTAFHNGVCASVITQPILQYKPEMVIDGDGTVVVPSALWTPSVQKYWVDLKSYGATGVLGATVDRKHHDILEVDQLRTLIQNLVVDSIFSSFPDFIHTSTPGDPAPDNALHFTLHSPLTIDLYDDLGNHTGFSTTTDSLEEDIPGSRYISFGEVQYVSVPASANLRLIMEGYEDGSFTLDIEETQGETVVAKTSFAGVPSFTDTVVKMDIPANAGIEGTSNLFIDVQGDGVVDIELVPKLNETLVFRIPYGWSGFLQPVNDPAHQVGQSMSVFKRGSTVPVKFQLTLADGAPIQADTPPQWLPPEKGAAMSATVGEPTYSDAATIGSVYKWDNESQQYVYNWNTKGLAAGYWYEIFAKLDDGNTYSVTVGLR